MKDIKYIIADNVRLYRKRENLTQMELAELVGVHRVSVGRLLQHMRNENLLEIRRGRLRLRPAFFSDKDLRCWHDLAAPADLAPDQ